MANEGTVKKLQIAGSFSGGGLPPPENPVVGQLLEISAVDENGKITATVGSDRLTELEAQVADLLYKAISITSFTNTVNTAEMGSTVSTVTLQWSLNKTPMTLSLDGETLDTTLRQKQLTGQSITSNKSWTLKAKDERDATASKTTGITFYNGVYYGASAAPESVDSAFVLGLTKTLTSSRARNITVNAGDGQYIWYCLPVRLGECTFKVGGFEGGFDLVNTFMFTNSSGYTESYRVYKSANAGLGDTAVAIS